MNAEQPRRCRPHDFTPRRIAVFGRIVSTILLSAECPQSARDVELFLRPARMGRLRAGVSAGRAGHRLHPRDHSPLPFQPSGTADRVRDYFHMGRRVELRVSPLRRWPAGLWEEALAWFGLAFATTFLRLRGSYSAVALLATVYGLINAAWLRVTRVTVKLPHLPEAWQGRTAALVTDIHLGPLSGQAFLSRRVIARLRSLKPDAVFFISGDMFDGSYARPGSVWSPRCVEFSAPWGIFLRDRKSRRVCREEHLLWMRLQRAGLRVLNNEKVSLDGLQIVRFTTRKRKIHANDPRLT